MNARRNGSRVRCSASPRNDDKHVYPREADRLRGIANKALDESEGAGNAGRLGAPAVRVKKITRSSPQVRRRPSGIPCASGFTVSFVVSLVIGLSCHHRRQFIFADLIPASRYQDATTSPSASPAFVLRQRQRPPLPAPNVPDDAQRPSDRARDGGESASDLPDVATRRPATNQHDGQISRRAQNPVKC
jgi:hypothetical protein